MGRQLVEDPITRNVDNESVHTESAETNELRNRNLFSTRADLRNLHRAKGSPVQGRAIGAFENLSNWSEDNADTNLTSDTGIVYQGSQSARVEAQADASVQISTEFASPVDLTKKDFSLAVRYSSGSPDNVQVNFHGPNEFVRFRAPRPPEYPDDEWFRADLGAEVETGPVDFSAIEKISIKGTNTTTADVIHVDFLAETPQPFDTGFCIIHDDNGHIDGYDVHAPILDEYGFSAHYAPIPDSIGNSSRLTVDQLQDLQSRGHEIGHKNYTNALPENLSSSELEDEIRKAKEWAGANGFHIGKWFLTPRGDRGFPELYDIAEETHHAVTSGMSVANGGLRGQISHSGYPISRSYIGGGGFTTSFQNAVEFAAQYNQVLHCYYHAEELSASEMRDICGKIEDDGLEVITLHEWWQMQQIPGTTY